MTVTILQTDTIWADPEANMAAAEGLMANAPQSDLYVLPEMWATGFAVKSPEDICSDAPLEWMKRMADSRKSAICGSVAVKTPDGIYRNRLYFVMPDGSFYYYDKRHLFTYAGEHEAYTRGEKRKIAVYKGIRFLLLTCYDLRFPVWARNNDDYDAIILVANWPASRQNAWHILLRARAIENQCFVIGANRMGSDPMCRYMGASAIIDAKGKTIAQASLSDDGLPHSEGETVTARIDMESLLAFRNKFPVLADRDTGL